MERLEERYLRDEALALRPLPSNQHAYQAGKSLETVLYQLVVRVEKTLDQQETAQGVFLDIEGAFNNTCCDTMCDALVRHGSDYTIVRWMAGIYGQSVDRRLSISPGKHATVFQAHVYAILACVHETETQDRPEKFALIVRRL
jgi:hypothetical protein